MTGGARRGGERENLGGGEGRLGRFGPKGGARGGGRLGRPGWPTAGEGKGRGRGWAGRLGRARGGGGGWAKNGEGGGEREEKGFPFSKIYFL
jgi:23S rRNA pseudouridine2605 synthase